MKKIKKILAGVILYVIITNLVAIIHYNVGGENGDYLWAFIVANVTVIFIGLILTICVWSIDTIIE
jgi:hypothetical protein